MTDNTKQDPHRRDGSDTMSTQEALIATGDNTPSRKDNTLHTPAEDLDASWTLVATDRTTRKKLRHRQTSNRSTTSAVSKVSNKPELVEMVLFNLELKPLLATFRSTYRDSVVSDN
jgi:hypothetical protein